MNETAAHEFSIDALRSGDRAEFARLVDAYSAPIYRLGLKMLGNPQDAEDILQNTFLNALTHLADFEGRSSVATWLYRIASNEALMLIRRKKNVVNLDDFQPEDAEETPLPEVFVDWSAMPEDELLSGESKGVGSGCAEIAGIAENGFPAARYRRHIHSGYRRDIEPDRNECKDPPAARTHVPARTIIGLLQRAAGSRGEDK